MLTATSFVGVTDDENVCAPGRYYYANILNSNSDVHTKIML